MDNKKRNKIPLAHSQGNLLKTQFLSVQENYERKIRELSIIKELGNALRSDIFFDQSEFWKAQLEIVQKYRPVAGIDLILEYEKSRQFHVKARLNADEDKPVAATQILPVHREVLSSRESLCIPDMGKREDLAMESGSILCLPIIHNKIAIGVLSFTSRITNDFDQNHIRFLNLVADHFSTAAILLRLYRQMLKEEKQRFLLSRFFSKTVSQQIMESRGILRLGGERRAATVLFADLKGFTAMSGDMEPEQVVDILNRYFSKMIPIIFKFDGTLDKVMGDGLLAVFGAPINHEDDPLKAVSAAISMIHTLAEFNDQNKGKNIPNLSVTMGINTGDVVAGYIGSEDHLNYTVIGDTVNMAQRIQSLAGKDEILISRSVHDAVSSQLGKIKDLKNIEKITPKKVKGKDDAIELFRIVY